MPGFEMEKSYKKASIMHNSNRSQDKLAATTSSASDLVLQWGNRKRLRCMKVQKPGRPESAKPVQRSERLSTRVDRLVVRPAQNNESNNQQNNSISVAMANNSIGGNGYINPRRHSASPSRRTLRNSDNSIVMRGQSNGVKGLASLDGGGGAHDRRATNHHHHHKPTSNNNRTNSNRGGGSTSSEAANDGKKGGSPPASDAIPAVWPPRFAIGLTNKEKEEDFLVLKGSKLPQRPKKRSKTVQRIVSLISPGAWLSDLSLERYEVREKKVSKKRPRGLKAMGNLESDTE